MNTMGFDKWYLGNKFILTHMGTSVTYYAIVLVLLFGYLESTLHRDWKAIALLSFSPVIFLFRLVYRFNGQFILRQLW